AGELPARRASERRGRHGRGRSPPSPRAVGAAGGRDRRARPGRRPRPVRRGHQRCARRADRRDHRLDLPAGALGLAAPRSGRAPEDGDGPAGRARGGGVVSAAAEAHPHGHGHGDANLHPPPIHYSSRISPVIVGIFLFIGSEIMLFGSFFTVYFFDRVVNNAHPWPPIDPAPGTQYERPGFVALVNTGILVTSSFTMHWATVSVKRNHRAGLQAGMVLTILLGLTFLLTQVIEYHRLGFNTSDGAFAATFFGLTGLHGCHVLIGLII